MFVINWLCTVLTTLRAEVQSKRPIDSPGEVPGNGFYTEIQASMPGGRSLGPRDSLGDFGA